MYHIWQWRLFEEGENKEPSDLHCIAFVPTTMIELNDKGPYVWVFTDSWAVANSLADGQ
jgi:hypothetical protein